MEVSGHLRAKTQDERSQVLKKQKLVSDSLRQMAEMGDSSHQVYLPDHSNWKVQEQGAGCAEEEEDRARYKLELEPSLTAYR